MRTIPNGSTTEDVILRRDLLSR